MLGIGLFVYITLSIMNDLMYYQVAFLSDFPLVFPVFNIANGAMTKGTICDSLSRPDNLLGEG